MISIRPYHLRSVRFLRVAEDRGWRLKVYSISPELGSCVPEPFVEEGIAAALDDLTTPRPPESLAGTDWHALPMAGVGSLMIHEGREAIYGILDAWIGENMMRHTVFVREKSPNGRFQPLRTSGVSVCVWELSVQMHERDAWVRHVMSPDHAPDLDAYLRDVVNADL